MPCFWNDSLEDQCGKILGLPLAFWQRIWVLKHSEQTNGLRVMQNAMYDLAHFGSYDLTLFYPWNTFEDFQKMSETVDSTEPYSLMHFPSS
jgi:hypothetical protein